MSSASNQDWEGRFVDGQFPLLQWLGSSERAEVFLTEVPGSPAQKAAVKLIPADEEEAEACLRDWAVTTKLSHPSLLRVFQTGQCRINARSMVYVVTEYADEVLAQILPERPLTPAEVKEMLGPILDALSYLHERGFVHGHLRPSNILVVNDQLKLSTDSILVAGELVPPLAVPEIPTREIYAAPEIAAGPVTPAADLWSLGVLIVEALTQHPPAWDRSRQKEPVLPKSLPQPFAGIARECLQITPERRCTLSDVKARLNTARSHSQPEGDSSRTVSVKGSIAAFAAAILVLAAIITAVELRSRSSATLPSAGVQSAPASEPTEPVQPPAKPSAAKPESRSPEPRPISQRPASASGSDGVLQQVLPDVSERARASIHGTVQVSIRVTVDSRGNVSDASLDSPNASQYFAGLALKAAHTWKFQPAAGTWLLRFRFTQSGTTVTPVQNKQ